MKVLLTRIYHSSVTRNLKIHIAQIVAYASLFHLLIFKGIMMGFMFLLSSMSKGRKLVKYQKRILSSGKENSLKEYIEFCLKDPGIAKIAALYELTEKDFIAMYYQFSIVGLNQYISGHYAALSTLAYGEPLLYAIIKNRDGMNKRELGHKLYQYWSNELPPGTLISEVKSSNQFKTA